MTHLAKISPWTARCATLLTLLALAAPATAQWAWRDENGRVVFSDRPPPSSIKADQIVRQPGVSNSLGAIPSNSSDPRDDGKAVASKDGPKTLAEREMEYRQRQQQRAEAEKKVADEQAANAQREHDCTRMRGYLRALEEGQRIVRNDAQGNREFIDDTARAAEVQRIRDQMKGCG